MNPHIRKAMWNGRIEATRKIVEVMSLGVCLDGYETLAHAYAYITNSLIGSPEQTAWQGFGGAQ